MTHGRTLWVASDWVEMTGLRVDDRYLMVNPYFHMFGLKAGILACSPAVPRCFPKRCSMSTGSWNGSSGEGVTVLPGPPTLYQAILDHPNRAGDRLSTPARGGDRSRRHPGRAGAPHRRGAAVLHRSSPATGSRRPERPRRPLRRTISRPSPTPSAGLAPVSSSGSSTDGSMSPPANPGEVVLRGGSVMSGYLDDPGATSRLVAGWVVANGRHRIDRRAVAFGSSGGSRTCSSSGASTPIPPRSRTFCCATPTFSRRQSSGSRTNAWARSEWPSWSQGQPSCSGPEIVQWCRAQMANYKVPRSVEIVDRLPMNVTGKVMKDNLREKSGA